MEEENFTGPEEQLAYSTAYSRKAPRRPGDMLLNALSLLLAVGTLGGIFYFGLVFTNPSAGYNLFPLPTLPATLFIPSLSPHPTRTAVLPSSVPITPTPAITATVQPTPTAIQATPLTTLGNKLTATPTVKVNSVFSFIPQADPKAIDATLFDASHGCAWMGLAGRVTDLQGSPATHLEVQLFGILDGKMINETSLTGTATQYGPSGYEFTLGNKPVASIQRLFVRLIDQAGVALSDRIFFDTVNDCSRNLVILNFKQVK